ncbi:MAG TPA: LysR family transcriptional regulator [Steroidobacter sp.]|uniref:winged helix-turn-helix domain-containing protein n=1 Tax=Steroidobacter sp. TaxID=1978227 RepID=UPI002ED7BD15
MSRLKITLRVDFDSVHAIGPGKVALLEKMRDCGSLSQAARELDMSYRRAWQLLASLNQIFREPLVLTSTGGSGGGGTTLTEFGQAIVAAYRQFEKETNARAEKYFGHMLETVSPERKGTKRTIARSLRSPSAAASRRSVSR